MSAGFIREDGPCFFCIFFVLFLLFSILCAIFAIVNCVVRYIILCLIALVSCPEMRAADVMHYERYATEDGLSHRFVSTIEEDSLGVIWMATWNGICRWDSINGFQTINETRDGQKLGRLLVVDPVDNGLLWCLDQNKDRTFLFNPQTRELTNAADRIYRRGGTKPYQLSLDSTGLTITRASSRSADFTPGLPPLRGTGEGLYFIPYPEGHNPDPDNRIVALLDHRGWLWVNWDEALWKITFQPAVFEHETHISGPQSGTFSEEIRAILHRRNGETWLASKNDCLYRYGAAGEFLAQKKLAKVYRMTETASGVWLASKGQGLFHWDGRNDGDVFCPIAGTPTDIYDLWMQDSLVWLATWGQGLVRGVLAGDVLKDPQTLIPGHKVRRLIPMRDGRLGVCTTQGLFLLNPDTEALCHAGEADFSDLCEVNDTLTLVASMGTGLYRLTADSIVRPFALDGVPDIILSLFRRGNEVWMVCDNALVTWVPGCLPRILDHEFWGETINFSEAAPAVIDTAEIQFATTRGRLILHPHLLPPLQKDPAGKVDSLSSLWWIAMLIVVIGGSAFWIRDWNKSRRTLAEKEEEAEQSRASEISALESSLAPTREPSVFESQLLSFIEAHYSESDLNTDTIAAAMAMSRTALFERVKQELHTTPASLLLDVRIAHATDMLKSGEKPVTEIAWLCGFSDARYFSKVYKKQTGISPRDVPIE